MRTLIAILITTCTLVLISCDNGDKKGNMAAQQLLAAWGNPEAIIQVANNYQAVSDSLGNPPSLSHSFINACTGNDTIKTVAQAIAYTPQSMGTVAGNEIVQGLMMGTMDATVASDRLKLINLAYALLQRNDDLEACYNAIDKVAQSLTEEKQMELYTRSCSPEALAIAMKQERNDNATNANRRAKIVESILTGEDLKTFKSIYYNK